VHRVLLVLWCSALLAACATIRRAPVPAAAPAGWEQRVAGLQSWSSWRLDGRAALAANGQGWQASLNWRQAGDSAEVHLSGPLGVGSLVLKRTPDGLSVNGAPPSDAVLAQLQERLGVDLPIDHLRFWLLGVPDPGTSFDFRRNDHDRASQLTQDGWTVDYDRYMPVDADLLPAHVVLSREGVRVRIVVDRWEPQR
jgi:outer membrane lipoprotein LolB